MPVCFCRSERFETESFSTPSEIWYVNIIHFNLNVTRLGLQNHFRGYSDAESFFYITTEHVLITKLNNRLIKIHAVQGFSKYWILKTFLNRFTYFLLKFDVCALSLIFSFYEQFIPKSLQFLHSYIFSMFSNQIWRFYDISEHS